MGVCDTFVYFIEKTHEFQKFITTLIDSNCKNGKVVINFLNSSILFSIGYYIKKLKDDSCFVEKKQCLTCDCTIYLMELLQDFAFTVDSKQTSNVITANINSNFPKFKKQSNESRWHKYPCI
ncbi:hypothetical protein ILUMI_00875 [Ignelater luminosus]|uniref:Uncharacterized protein n=1 Tax=Ignelater luminosus TaxID=2038154 RepID=A0A8K0DL26_IGNLU|nr:hypothetical protein ILUMI_00875 [Ignelater luminosus]